MKHVDARSSDETDRRNAAIRALGGDPRRWWAWIDVRGHGADVWQVVKRDRHGEHFAGKVSVSYSARKSASKRSDNPTATPAQIRALRDEAAAHGDHDMARICDRALAGSKRAITYCARVIREAKTVQRSPNPKKSDNFGSFKVFIKTAPHEQWSHPSGWEYDSLEEAKAGARKAERQWMAVRLYNVETGRVVPSSTWKRKKRH